MNGLFPNIIIGDNMKIILTLIITILFIIGLFIAYLLRTIWKLLNPIEEFFIGK